MKLAKWGNSFAIRLPAKMIQDANLKEGDDVKVRIVNEGELQISRDAAKEEALEVIRRLARPLPADYKFNREEIHDRFDRSVLGRELEARTKQEQETH